MSETILNTWLDQQCRQIPGVRSGFILSAKNKKQTLTAWPGNHHGLTAEINQSAQLSLAHKKPLIKMLAPDNRSGDATIISTPLDYAGLTDKVFTLACDSKTADSGKILLQQIHNSLPQLKTAMQPANNKSDVEQTLTQITQTLATSLAEEDLRSTAMALCAELKTQFDCQRVSFGIRQKNRSKVYANSQHSSLPERSRQLTEIAALMDESADQVCTICVPQPGAAISAFHRQYSAHHQQSCICTVPLVFKEKVVATLCFERSAEQLFDKKTVALLEHISSFLAPVIQLKSDLAKPWFQRLTTSPKKSSGLGNRKQTPAVAAIILCFCGLTLLSTIPVTMQITAKARIEAAVQRSIAAPGNGYIDQVLARPGDLVRQGTLLLKLEDNELRIEKNQYESELAQFRADYSAALAGSDRSRMMIIDAKSREISAKLALVEKKLARTHLYAPFDAEIIDGDLLQSLGAPVKQGETLMTLAPQGDFRTMLEIDEVDINLLPANAQGNLSLKSNPGKTLGFRLEKITPLARSNETGNIFEAEAAITANQNIALRPGMEGLAKIEIGEKPWLWQATRRLRRWLYIQYWRWGA